MSTEGGTKAIVAALAANLGIAVTKFVAFLLTGVSARCWPRRSTRSPTPATRRCCCSAASAAAREATPEHPFGYGRERYIYAFIVSIVLFSVGGLFALYEAWHKVAATPHADRPTGSGCRSSVLVVAIVMEGFSFRTAISEAQPDPRAAARGCSFVRRAKAPELPVVLLEDFAALVGLVFALFGVGLTLLTGNGIWDGVGTALHRRCCWSAVAVVLAIEMK